MNRRTFLGVLGIGASSSIAPMNLGIVTLVGKFVSNLRRKNYRWRLSEKFIREYKAESDWSCITRCQQYSEKLGWV